MKLVATRSQVPERRLLERLGRTQRATRFYWRSPAADVELLGLGEVAAIEGAGPDRLTRAAESAAALWRGLELRGAEIPAQAGPLLVGGFGFWDEATGGTDWSDFPALRFWVPELLYARIGDRSYTTVTTDLEAVERPSVARQPWRSCSARRAEGFSACAEPSRDEFASAVSRATAAIGAGELEKVVLARACTLTQAGGFDAARVLGALCESQPGCFVYGVGLGAASFVGASPERLVRLAGGEVSADALAGSAPRGRTPEEDARRGQALLDSPKEREEHAIVRRAVVEALAPRSAELRAAESPRLLRLEGIQHLHTPVSATLPESAHATTLSLASALFPTPAVGGAPRAAALEFLRRHESARRGWYSGAIGWLTPGGDGELCVALRSALLRGDAATLHAGVGIVAGSTPEAELDETRWKLASALGALVEL
ncbi:MAG TPA: isochorismate synthase [Myxococcota bacterium]|nr:isochorismate synthase [Myxococcota bacterium]